MLLKENHAYPNVLYLLPRFGVNLDLCFWNKHFAANALAKILFEWPNLFFQIGGGYALETCVSANLNIQRCQSKAYFSVNRFIYREDE